MSKTVREVRERRLPPPPLPRHLRSTELVSLRGSRPPMAPRAQAHAVGVTVLGNIPKAAPNFFDDMPTMTFFAPATVILADVDRPPALQPDIIVTSATPACRPLPDRQRKAGLAVPPALPPGTVRTLPADASPQMTSPEAWGPASQEMNWGQEPRLQPAVLALSSVAVLLAIAVLIWLVMGATSLGA